ncbi:MAG TPA: ABC transporter permease [Acidimicrobiales bacterium]|nr:ABC transporter permease [Acidimicrobiales bacterium]
MTASLLIAAKDLRQRLRDRSAIVIGLVAPLVIAALMSLAFRGATTFHFNLAVVNYDKGPIAGQLLRVLREPGLDKIISTRSVATEAASSAQLQARKVQAAIVIPTGFSSSMTGAAPESIRVLSSVNNTLAGSITASIVSSFTAQLNADRLSIATAAASGAPPDRLAALQTEATRLTIPLQLAQRPVGSRELSPVSYYSPAMAIFFLLFVISFTARSFFVDRGEGMIERMRAAPVRPIEILAGKALSVFVFGVASLGVVAVVTTAAFGAYWGSPVAVAAVCIALVLSVVCLTALVIGLARSQRQAEGIASAVVFGLALLGGNFVFVSAEPDLLRRLSLLTPNGWALRAFTDLATRGGGLHTVLVPIAAILAFTAIVGAAAAGLSRRAVTA